MANIALELQKLANSAQVQIQKLSNEATEKTFKYNTTEANAARQWQTQMSNTSHQREVADLKAAGLNPILSAGGNGAQSYTTSSASAAAENASQAYSSIASSRLSGLAGVEQSKISAAATRNAAAQNAAAMRAAAAAQASAARYAASMNYLTSKERNEANIKINREAWQVKRDIAFNAPTGNPIKIVDRQLSNMGMYKGISSGVKEAAKNIVKIAQTEPTKLLNTNKLPASGKITSKNFKINMLGSLSTSEVNKIVNGLGIENNERNKTLVFKAFALNDVASQVILKSLYNNAKLSYKLKLLRFNKY